MKDRKQSHHKNALKKAADELEIVKTIMEKQNKTIPINEKNYIIHDLHAKLRSLTLEMISLSEKMESTRKILRDLKTNIEKERSKALQEGAQKVIEEIVSILVEYETDCLSGNEHISKINHHLFTRLIDFFKERYKVEVIDETPERIDPTIHQVITMVDEPDMNSLIVQLSKGYRIGKKVIHPMRLKIIKGGKESHKKGSSRPYLRGLVFNNTSDNNSHSEDVS